MSYIKVGNIIEGQITGVTKYGIFVSLEDNYVGLIHISEVSNKFVKDLEQKFKIGDLVKVKVLSTTSVWHGITYREDKEELVKAINNLVKSGEYPSKI